MTQLPLSPSKTLVVGFTGHRQLHDEEKAAEVLRQILGSLQKEAGLEIIARSSVASGADILFAEACQSLNLKWIAQLPFPEIEFQKDFSEKDWARAKALLGQASEVEIFSRAAHRPDDYLECGRATVDGADLMIALWDGNASRGTGGTAEIVAHTRAVSKALILIDATSLQVSRERFTPLELKMQRSINADD